jgi:hypothetical protein
MSDMINYKEIKTITEHDEDDFDAEVASLLGQGYSIINLVVHPKTTQAFRQYTAFMGLIKEEEKTTI